MPASPTPPVQNTDDNLDDLGRDLRTGKTDEKQHPQMELEIGKQKPQEDKPNPPSGKSR